MNNEIENIFVRYEKRKSIQNEIYNLLNPSVYMSQQELEREMLKWFKDNDLLPLSNKKLLEIGCGNGANLAKFIKYGFLPENLLGNELLSERINIAKKILPSMVRIIKGDASLLDIEENSYDVVFQSTVFTSILHDELKRKIADKMWSLLKPGGFILWYDFIYNNPKNADVKGIKIKEIKSFFPKGDFKYKKVTLAPPINRITTKINPNLYYIFNLFSFLRTHVLCSIQKTEE